MAAVHVSVDGVRCSVQPSYCCRVVSRFDAALARQDLPAMAGCARIMAEFRWGRAVIQGRACPAVVLLRGVVLVLCADLQWLEGLWAGALSACQLRAV